MNSHAIIDSIFDVFNKYGDRHYGESVSEREHALQTAEFARQFGESDAIVLSCLLHDFGHMLHNQGEDIAQKGVNAKHEELGYDLLKPYFPKEILEPIRQHVAAKRYLCWQSAAYAGSLSKSSQLSLQLQGGPMTDEEARCFEENPHFSACIRVRRYDDQGKVPNMATHDLEFYRSLIKQFLV